jgi:hypothetical protein
MGLKNWLTASLKKFFVASSEPLDDSSRNNPNPARQLPLSRLTRYIFQASHFSRVNQRVKPGAFLPQPPDLKISSVWIDQLGDGEIWDIGDLLGAKRNAKPIARASFDAQILSEPHLTIEADPMPHPKHVNICGWPAEKDAQKAVALLLCNRSTLQVRTVAAEPHGP